VRDSEKVRLPRVEDPLGNECLVRLQNEAHMTADHQAATFHGGAHVVQMVA
jgi:hypothetical protein